MGLAELSALLSIFASLLVIYLNLQRLKLRRRR